MTTTISFLGRPRTGARIWIWLSACITALGLWGCGGSSESEDRAITQPVAIEHIRIRSARTFDDVKAELESRLQKFDISRLIAFLQQGDIAGARAEMERQASPVGLLTFYSLDHGSALALEGNGPRKAVAYGIGNLLVASSMTKLNLGAGLYAPIRVVLYAGADGNAIIEYDRPSSNLAVFGDPGINSVANQLDVAMTTFLTGIAAVDTLMADRVITQPVVIEHIRISSARSFGDVKAALESRLKKFDISRLIAFLQQGDIAGARAEMERQASPVGLLIFYALDHGSALALEGNGPRKAVAYGLGNLLVASSMTKLNLGAGLYAPIRVVLYEGADGTAVIEYDRPSSNLTVFGDPGIDSVANQLDVAFNTFLRSIGE